MGREKGKQGEVAQVIYGTIDSVHLYDVQLNDGMRIRCFGFELELLEIEPSKAAEAMWRHLNLTWTQC